MKRVFGVMLVSVLLLGTMSVFAGEGCCAAGTSAKPADCFAKLNLTADQKAKVDALQADCKTSACTMAAHEKLAAGLKTILTPEQYTQWTKACEQAKGAKSGGTCPFSSKPKEDSSKTTEDSTETMH